MGAFPRQQKGKSGADAGFCGRGRRSGVRDVRFRGGGSRLWGRIRVSAGEEGDLGGGYAFLQARKWGVG